MSIRPILQWPDPRLEAVCAGIEAVTPDVVALARDMLETMYAAPGRGLAAPQVGILQRLFVMDAGWKDGTPDPYVFINPVLTAQSDERVTSSEGCLSIPGVLAGISRPAKVEMSWTDEQGHPQSASFDGFEAACVQHELDHLNGIVTLDHLDRNARADLLAARVEALL